MTQPAKRLLASAVVILIWLIDLMAASPALHERIHVDAGKPDHHCAVTVFAHGQIDSAVCQTVAPTVPITRIREPASVTLSVIDPVRVLLPPSRAPPVSSP